MCLNIYAVVIAQVKVEQHGIGFQKYRNNKFLIFQKNICKKIQSFNVRLEC